MVDRDDTVDDATAPVTDRANVALALDNYELREVLGRGGMGEVVAARDRKIDREVAIKRLRSATPTSDELVRFEREARLQARLDHPAIVPVHELGCDASGRPYFTMKRLVGTTLHDRLRTATSVQPLLRALVDVCFALELAHERGIVHRDVKPSNIMLGNYNEVYVLDWGVARVVGEAPEAATPLTGTVIPDHTATGTLLGTPGYMAPEQMRNADVRAAADVYSLGAILFEILAGEPLHPSGSAALASTLEHPTQSPARRRPDRDVAPELDATCVAALADDPVQRPTARELAMSIQAYLDGDRDLERRRMLAAKHLAAANDALASGDPERRRVAAQLAGRALALDPSSADAARIVTQLIVEPPRKLPAELVASLAANEIDLDRERSRRAAIAYLSVLAWVAMWPFLPIVRWSEAIGVPVVALALAGLLAHHARTGRVPLAVLMSMNLAIAVLFSQLASPFLLTPMLVCAQILAIGSYSRLEGRLWPIASWTIIALLLPHVLEYVGVLPRTWWWEHDGLHARSAIADYTPATTAVPALILCHVALAFVVAYYAVGILRVRRDAQRAAHIQAWHLKHLLPRGASQV